jgi:hypothetical protein
MPHPRKLKLKRLHPQNHKLPKEKPKLNQLKKMMMIKMMMRNRPPRSQSREKRKLSLPNLLRLPKLEREKENELLILPTFD